MTAQIALELLLCGTLVAMSAFFSGSEAALFSLKAWQLESAKGGKPQYAAVTKLLSDPPLLLVCVLLGNETVNVTLSFISSSIRSKLFPGAWGAALAVVATSLVLILLGEALPKAVSAHFPLPVAKTYAPALSVLVKAIGVPGGFLLRNLERLPAIRQRPQLDPLDEVRHLIAAAQEAGSFRRDEQEILSVLLRMHQEPASGRMIPRTAIRFVARDSSPQEIVLAAREAEGGWIAVRGESEDDLVGLLSTRDVLEWQLGGAKEPLSRWIHAVPVFPETRPLRLLFDEVFEGGSPAAILADEYGGVAGIVTRASLAQSLLCGGRGLPGSGHGVVLPGSIPYSQLREKYGDAPADPKCKTLAGHILNLAQKVPREGESVQDGAFRYTVIKATPRQVLEVEVAALTK